MTKRLYYEFFYYHSIPEMLLWGVLLLFFWTASALLFQRKGWTKAWIWINRAVLIVVVGFILYWTVGKRGTGTKQEFSLIPFYSFIAAKTQPEMYREVVANILLFIPVGLSMPFALCRPRWVSTGQKAQVSSGADGKVSNTPGLNDSTAQVEHGTDNSRALETGSSGDLETRNRRPILTTVLFALLLSLTIELAQWKWGLGLAETDDVIMNTLGAAAGTLAFFFSRYSRFLPSLDHKG